MTTCRDNAFEERQVKFLCVGCDEAMRFVATKHSPRGESLTVVFCCPRCDVRIALSTNAGETRLVHSLGLSVAAGGQPAAPQPLESAGTRLTEARPLWTEEAERRLQRVPGFVRPMVRESIERYAREHGYQEVNFEVMDEARARIGM